MIDPYVPMDRKKIVKDTAVAGNVVTTLTVPAGERWLLLNGNIVLTTDATVANRIPRLKVQDVLNVTKITIPAQIQAASLGPSTYSWTQTVSVTDKTVNALGLQILDAGEDVVFYIFAGQAGDAYDYLLEYLKVEI